VIDESAGTPGVAEAAEDQPVPASPPGRRRRRLAWIAFSLVAAVATLLYWAGIAATWTVHRSFPQYSGTLHLSGLSAPVKVYRDAHAVPQIYAATADDLFRAQGYVTAQERFWEMDFRRHATSGRMAELFGPSQVGTDKFLRTLGWRAVAEREWTLISPQTRKYLQDYADGVNAYLSGRSTAEVSLEYAVLGLVQTTGYTIAPWDPVDSLAWLKAMAWDLRGNIHEEVARGTLLAAGLSRDQVESLFPPYPAQLNAPILSGGSLSGGAFVAPPRTSAASLPEPVSPGVGAAIARVAALIGPARPDLGSNSFVVSGNLTATGKPILENDPHLGPSMPGVWFQVGLHCSCEFNVEGFSFSGVPGIIIGHNARIAWGFSNLNPDVIDLYLEKVQGDRYLVDGAWQDLTVRVETIKVAGAAPVKLTVRSTNNGPLLEGVSSNLPILGKKPAVDPSGMPLTAAAPADPAYAVSLRWTGLDPGKTMDALFALNTAGNWDQFRHAIADFAAPSQNIVYADVGGNIGYQASGEIPVRGKGDGRWPAPGWDSSYNWTGRIPFEALPNELNPASGYIVTANQEVVDPATYPYLLTDDWSNGYRSRRLADLITSANKLSTLDAAALAMDTRNDLAAQIVPRLLAVKTTGATARAQNLLRDWDFQQPADGKAGSAQAHSSAAAAYFNAVWRHLLAGTFDELPREQRPNGDDRWWLVLTNLMQDPGSAWWDVKATPQKETRDDVLKTALDQGASEMAGALGNDPRAWRWGSIHTLTVRNQSFGSSGVAPIEWIFNPSTIGVPGGGAMVNATGWDPSTGGYDTNAVPSMRMVVDLSNLDNSRWVQLTGESGHAFSKHYSDQLELWRTGQTTPMRWDEAAIRREATDVLTLR
jgi:penicillin amidase